MSKKGGVQQLQADVNTDEDFEKFLERPGLLVMDVYTEWCGPCVGMIGSLKKIKLELGGDNLQLAVCKSNTIEALKRFRNKSEPTWLFASSGKAVNILFGTNAPLLVKIIAEELELESKYRNGQAQRIFYEITELQPIEVELANQIKVENELNRTLEIQEIERKRQEYLTQVTDIIMENIQDCGVTMFSPHVSRDMFKKLMDVADGQKLTCKDRRVTQITPEDLKILHFGCDNPLDPEVWEQLYHKDLLICFWKMAENEKREIDEILIKYVHELTKRDPILDEFGEPKPNEFKPSVLPSLEVTVKIAIEKPDLEEETGEKVGESQTEKGENDEEDDNDDGDIINAVIKSVEQPKRNSMAKSEVDKEESRKDSSSIRKESTPEIICYEEKIILVPPVWAPNNKRCNASAIYLLFRPCTSTFLPPDPEPVPPHIAMVFEAYKRKNIFEVCENYKDDILLYGYFTNAHPEETTLIANSTKKYEKLSLTVTDKLVLKVAKYNTDIVLTLASHGPCYVSANTVRGEADCLKFFPPGYKTGEMEELEMQMRALQKKKKKKKKKHAEEEPPEGSEELSSAPPDGENPEEEPPEGEEAQDGEGENGEDGTESQEDNLDSVDQ